MSWSKLDQRLYEELYAAGCSAHAFAVAPALIVEFSNRLGIFRLHPELAALRLRIDEKPFLAALSEICKLFDWPFDDENRVLFIRGWFKHQTLRSSQFVVWALKDLPGVPDTPLLVPWAEAGRAVFTNKRLEVFEAAAAPRLARLDAKPAPEPKKPERVPKKVKNTTPKDESFEVFWDIWPRKKAQPAALKAWCRLPVEKGSKLFDTIIADVNERKDCHAWTKEGRQYCPYPATYLNQKRWNDIADPEGGGAAPNLDKQWEEEK